MKSKYMCKDLDVSGTTQVITSDIVSVEGYPFSEMITLTWYLNAILGSHTLTVQGKSHPDEPWGTGTQVALNGQTGVVSIKNYPYMRLRINMTTTQANRKITVLVGR